MLFTDFHFFILLIITLGLFYLTKNQTLQTIILIIASFVFYAWNFPFLLLVLLTSIAINIATVYSLSITYRISYRRAYAFLGVVTNLVFLSLFKYGPLLGTTFFERDSSLGGFLIAIPLPIGISFFTFQGISLVVDTFKGKELKLSRENPRQHIFNIALFQGFFPQLIAGPIVKAHDFLPQISVKLFSRIDWDFVFKNLVSGYFLKMVVADNLKDQTFWIAYPYFITISGFTLFIVLIGYSMQIFADFAGYSLIAIGLAAMFGYKLRVNFLFPYISKSFSEFWQRWHISLSTFLKEYLYIPLGGNRKGKVRTYANLMITMILGGLWHGAAWSYAVWGVYHGTLLISERLLKNILKIQHSAYPQNLSKFISVLRVIVIFLLVSFGWVFFKLPVFEHAVLFFQTMVINLFSTPNAIDTIFFVAIYSIPVIIYHILYLYKNQNTYSAINNVTKLEPIFYGSMMFLLLCNSGSSGSFIYFQF